MNIHGSKKDDIKPFSRFSEKYRYEEILEQFNNKINRKDYILKLFKLLSSTKNIIVEESYSIKSWNRGRIIEKLRLWSLEYLKEQSFYICIKNRLSITIRDELKVGEKKPDPRIPFFLYSSPGPLSSPPRIRPSQLVQPNGAPWIISNPILLYRFEQRPWFFREKKTILLGNFVVAGQLESGTRKRARHWSIQEPTIESRFHVFSFDFRIDRFNGRTWLRIAPSFARVVPLSRRISLSPCFLTNWDLTWAWKACHRA